MKQVKSMTFEQLVNARAKIGAAKGCNTRGPTSDGTGSPVDPTPLRRPTPCALQRPRQCLRKPVVPPAHISHQFVT